MKNESDAVKLENFSAKKTHFWAEKHFVGKRCYISLYTILWNKKIVASNFAYRN